MMRFLLVFVCVLLPTAGFGQQNQDDSVFEKPLQDFDSAFRDVAAQLQKSSCLKSNFIQNRHIQGLSKPIVSKGIFIYDAARGAAWIQEQPLKIAYVVTFSGMKQISMTSGLASQTAPPSPTLQRLSKTLISVFGGNVEKLHDNFSIFFDGQLTSWTLGLKPKDSTISAFLASIVLRGDTFTRSISISDESGDSSQIVFSEMEIAPEV